MVSADHERRQYGRIELEDAIEARMDDTSVRIVELSVTGFKVAHDVRFAPVPVRRMTFSWNDEELEFSCGIVRSVLFRLGRRPGEPTIYHSGVKIIEALGDSDRILRDLIAERVIRALEEQKANARGVLPVGEYKWQVEKGDRFRRCEFTNGVWRKFDTTNSQQPENGFTISSGVDPVRVDLLCRTWEQTTEHGRKLTQILAQLSISKKEGTPTRRYVP